MSKVKEYNDTLLGGLASEPKGPRQDKVTLFVFTCFIIPAIGGLLFGFDIGSTTFVEATLKNKYPHVDSNKVLKGMFTSAGLAGALFGAMIAFNIGDFLGRRRILLIASFFYVLGSCIAALGISLEMVMAGKAVFGLGIGFAMHSAPVYIAEISPPGVRGFLVSCKEGLIVVGMLLGNFTGFIFSTGDDWRYILVVGGALGLAFGVGMFFLPSSARWMIMRDIRQTGVVRAETKQALMRLRGATSEEEVQQEMNEVIAAVQSAQGGSGALLMQARGQLVVALGLVILQQITGQPTVLYYSGDVLKNAIGNSNAQTAGASCLVTSVKALATTLSVVMVDRLGRRLLLLVGIAGMTIATTCLAIVFHFYGTDDANLGTILFLMLYVASYQIGFGPIVWLLISELFPNSVRSRAVAISVFTNFGANLIMTFSFSIMESKLGITWTFVIYASLCLVALFFVFAKLPETKGKKLEEIAALFQK